MRTATFFIAVLMAIQVASAQSLVVSGSRNSIIVSGKSEPAAKIEVDAVIPKKETVVQADPIRVVPVLPVEGEKKYLAMFTANYCGGCRIWKGSVKKELERMGYTVREYDMTTPDNQLRYGQRVNLLPSFVVCDWGTGKWLSDLAVGQISTHTAVSMLGAVQQQATTPAQVVVHRSSQGRYYSYGGRTYDLETYGGCSMRNCGMCAEIRGAQRRYQESKVLINKVGPQAASPDDVVSEALSLMQDSPVPLTKDSVFCDLGCGNGSVLIAAAKRVGCRCIGVEIDDAKVEEARRMVLAHGLSHLVEVVKGDVRDFDPARHFVTHIYAYLYEDLLKEIADKLKSVDVAVCPGHECPGIGMKLVGQCWIRRRNDGQVQGDAGRGLHFKEGSRSVGDPFGYLVERTGIAYRRRDDESDTRRCGYLSCWTRCS